MTLCGSCVGVAQATSRLSLPDSNPVRCENIRTSDMSGVNVTQHCSFIVHLSPCKHIHSPMPKCSAMTKTQDKAMTIPLTEEEGRLIEIAVRLACAIQYWEKHFRKMDSESRDQLLKKGIDHELVRNPNSFHDDSTNTGS